MSDLNIGSLHTPEMHRQFCGRSGKFQFVASTNPEHPLAIDFTDPEVNANNTAYYLSGEYDDHDLAQVGVSMYLNTMHKRLAASGIEIKCVQYPRVVGTARRPTFGRHIEWDDKVLNSVFIFAYHPEMDSGFIPEDLNDELDAVLDGEFIIRLDLMTYAPLIRPPFVVSDYLH